MPVNNPEPQSPSDSQTTFDVVGIGNALVDVISHDSDATLDRLGLSKGTMHLIDEVRSREIYSGMGPAVEMSGGSAANTIVGVASFGGSAKYLGKVRGDQLGEVFQHDIRSLGVTYDTPLAASGPDTGRCLILVTPDAQRTMNTFLGASVHFGPDDVDVEAVEASKIVYLEGYLFDPPEAQEAFFFASRKASAAGTEVSLTLSDPFCVERHREAFRQLVADHVDVIFANEVEICSLYQVDSFDEAATLASQECSVCVLTRGAAGSLVLSGGEAFEIAAQPVARVVDTTGAGDLYAAGFLFGYTQGFDFDTCGSLGSVGASEVISHMGARPEAVLADLASEIVSQAQKR